MFTCLISEFYRIQFTPFSLKAHISLLYTNFTRKQAILNENLKTSRPESQFKNASGVLAAAWSNAKHSSTDHACDPPEALSWKEIGLPPRRNCCNSPPIEVGVSSSFKMNRSSLYRQLFRMPDIKKSLPAYAERDDQLAVPPFLSP